MGSSGNPPLHPNTHSIHEQPSEIGSDGRVPCRICGRKFAADRIAKHQGICRKIKLKAEERGEFDVTESRTKEIREQLPQNYRGKTLKLGKVARGRKGGFTGSATRFGGRGNGGVLPKDERAKEKKKNNWREQHANFIANVRNAKKITKFMDAGGDARDIDTQLNLAPTPSQPTSNMVDCPHCGRSFSELVAERHLPKCKNIINRPKPPKGAGFSLKGETRSYSGGSRVGGQGGGAGKWGGRGEMNF